MLSSNRNTMASPRARMMPSLVRIAGRPLLRSCLRYTMRSSRKAASRMVNSDPSDEPSSMTISSKSSNVCAIAESRHLASSPSALRQ